MAFQKQHYETPDERLKRMIIERLNDAMVCDSNEKKKAYCINVKHFLRIMKRHMPREVIDKIEKLYTEMEAGITRIKEDKGKTRADIEILVMNTQYEFYDNAIVYGIDALQNSNITQKEVEGIILAGKTLKDMDKLGKAIRKSNAVETVITEIGGEFELEQDQ